LIADFVDEHSSLSQNPCQLPWLDQRSFKVNFKCIGVQERTFGGVGGDHFMGMNTWFEEDAQIYDHPKNPYIVD
jgi:hypothetical protein